MCSNNYNKLISEEECLEIIRKDFNLATNCNLYLNKYEIIKASSKLLGFMGEYFQLRITVNIQDSNNCDLQIRQYFVKSLPITNQFHRADCESKNFFRKEAAIYRNILPKIQQNVKYPLFARCFLARDDLIVLEDLRSAQSILDPTQKQKNCYLQHVEETGSYTKQHIELFLKYLAQLHAASLAWIKENNIDIEKYNTILWELLLNRNNQWYLTSIKSIIYLAKRHWYFQYTEAQIFIDQKLYDILFNIDELTNPSKNLHNVFCHRDAWGHNIFFENDHKTNKPIACRMIDFQQSRISPPAIDVLYFLYNTIIAENSEQWNQSLKEYLDFYYENLCETLNDLSLPSNLISRQDFELDCRNAVLPNLVAKASCEPLMKLPEGWSQTLRNNEPELYDYYMNVDRIKMFQNIEQLYPDYIKIIQQPIEALMKYFGFEPQAK